MRRFWFLPSLMLLLSSAYLHIASAQPVLGVQPFLGFAWPTHSIPVSVKAPESNVRQAVLEAMGTWNLAQEWFATTYMTSRGAPFVFFETNSTYDSMVTVNFNQTQTIDDLGRTDSKEWYDQQENFQKVTVSITLDLTKQDGKVVSDAEMLRLATHELGHALGLDHTTFDPNDLMNHVTEAVFPSTLNLYAVYLLRTVTNAKDLPQQPVSLPNNIPYLVVSQVDLENVTPPVVESTTTSFGVKQLAYAITYGPWLWIGMLAALAAVVVASISRRHKGGLARVDTETQVIFRDEPSAEQAPIESRKVRKCPHCGAEARQGSLICTRCGMPTYS